MAEMTFSARAVRDKINNTPGEIEKKNLAILINNLLNPVRQAWGAPLIVTSGYRSPVLNRAVGGVKTSHHLKGMAADLVTKKNTPEANRKLYNFIKTLPLKWTQLIWETNKQGATWVHISYDLSNLKCQIL